MKPSLRYALAAAILLTFGIPAAWACSCPNCQEAHAAAMKQALTTIEAQKPIPANSVVHAYKNPNCENQLGNYGGILNALQQLAGQSNNQTAQTIAQVLQTLFGQTQNACGGSGGGVSTTTTQTNWAIPANPQNIQSAINPQGGPGNADFQNLFQ